jgi:hypothetical protein
MAAMIVRSLSLQNSSFQALAPQAPAMIQGFRHREKTKSPADERKSASILPSRQVPTMMTPPAIRHHQKTAGSMLAPWRRRALVAALRTSPEERTV